MFRRVVRDSHENTPNYADCKRKKPALAVASRRLLRKGIVMFWVSIMQHAYPVSARQCLNSIFTLARAPKKWDSRPKYGESTC
jgi:hypothetical protein